MSENNPENQEQVKKEDLEKEESDVKETLDTEKEVKTKFTFKCTRCDACCLGRGPIPITFWDLELWARNGVVANFMPYLDIYQRPDGNVDLILKPLPPSKETEAENHSQDPFETVPVDELLEAKCPLYNKDDKKCLIYDNRPLSCRTYPLEFDGKNFIVVDADCPGIGEEGMTKEELIEMRETAKNMHYELTRMRIALPVLNQIVSSNFMKMLMKQQMEAMSKMSDEDKEKLDEIFKKQEQDLDHDHNHDH
ncbi:MAG: YkgJ family cysteine cluster protein [Candidatus Hermodarchaeota archaeon]